MGRLPLQTDAIVFKYATERELERLGACFSVADCKRSVRPLRPYRVCSPPTPYPPYLSLSSLLCRALGEIFGGRDLARDAESDGFLLDLHFHAYSYPPHYQ